MCFCCCLLKLVCRKIVTHDRALMQHLATKVLDLSAAEPALFDGTFEKRDSVAPGHTFAVVRPSWPPPLLYRVQLDHPAVPTAGRS